MKNIITLCIVALLLGGVGTMMLSAKCGKKCDSSSCDKNCGNCGKGKSCGSCR